MAGARKFSGKRLNMALNAAIACRYSLLSNHGNTHVELQYNTFIERDYSPQMIFRIMLAHYALARNTFHGAALRIAHVPNHFNGFCECERVSRRHDIAVSTIANEFRQTTLCRDNRNFPERLRFQNREWCIFKTYSLHHHHARASNQ